MEYIEFTPWCIYRGFTVLNFEITMTFEKIAQILIQLKIKLHFLIVTGLNVNVIAVGLSNGRIRLYSTWDLTLLREISINLSNDPSLNNVGCIISLTFTRERLYAADTYAKVYILESAYAPASLVKNGFSIGGQQINSSTSGSYLSNLICFS